MSFLAWLFDRSATCERLKDACSMYERQGNCLLDRLTEERRVMGDINAQGMMREAALDAEVRELAAERDGVMRELWMERRRNDELRERFALTDANVKCCFAAMGVQAGALTATVDRLRQELTDERTARREEVAAERAVVAFLRSRVEHLEAERVEMLEQKEAKGAKEAAE